MKRINVTVRADQYTRISQDGLNASGLIRGLLDDHFSNEKIVFSVGAETRQMYQQIISNFGGDDRELERFFTAAMDDYLREKGEQIMQLRQNMQTASMKNHLASQPNGKSNGQHNGKMNELNHDSPGA